MRGFCGVLTPDEFVLLVVLLYQKNTIEIQIAGERESEIVQRAQGILIHIKLAYFLNLQKYRRSIPGET